MSATTVVPLRRPDEIEDPLTGVLRSGARRLLAQAVEAEAEAFLATLAAVRPDGRERLVRHGHGPERQVQTGIGPVAVRRVKLRDRGTGEAAERIRFTSSILPRWARRTPSLDALLPVLYLRGVSMGDFQEALAALLGKDGPNLSRAAAGRVGGGPWALAAARPVGPALRLSLGGRGLPAGADGTAGRVHAGADRRDARGQEGACRLPGRHARERAELAGTAGRPQGTRLGNRARAGHRRRGARLLEGARRGLAQDPPSALYRAPPTSRTSCRSRSSRRPRPTCARSGWRRTGRRPRRRS